MVYTDIHSVSEEFLNTLDHFKITSAESNNYNYIDEDAIASYWYKIIGEEDEQYL